MAEDVYVTGLENPINDDGYSNIFAHIRHNKEHAAKRIELALIDAERQDLVLINPMLDKEELIDAEWERYNSFTKPFRRKSDWIALQYLGMDNTQIYDHLKRAMYDKEYVKDAIITDGNCGSSDDPLNLAEDADMLYYVPDSQKVDDIDQAFATIEDIDHKNEIGNNYMRDTGYVLLIPSNIPNLDILENYWSAYKSMVMRHQRMADWMTVELYGLTNEQIYIGLKEKFLKNGQTYQNDDNDPNVELYVSENKLLENYFDTGIKKNDFTNRELAQGLMNVARRPDFYDKATGKKLITHAIDQYEDLTVNVPSNSWDYTDLPAYTPDEMIDAGVFSGGVDPEGQQPNDDIVAGHVVMSEEWFKEYCTFFSTGIMSEEFRRLNMERVQKLEQLYAIPREKRVATWNEQVRRNGWDPKYLFSENNRAINDVFMRRELRKVNESYADIIDISDIQESTAIHEMDFTNSPIKPIFIILFAGKSQFAKSIRAFTGSKYSHAMLSLDSSFKKCYSYGMEGAKSKLGGFIIEDLTNKPKNSPCKIYVTFVKDKVWETIKKNIDWFVQMQAQTRYSFKNIIGFLFQIPYQTDLNMICSQFVDRMIKLGNIDFTKKASSLLSPADLDQAARANKKIYTIFQGLAEKINPKVIARKVDAAFQKGKVLESAQFCIYKEDATTQMIYEHLLAPIDEIKELPVRITAKGDVLVNRFKKIDYEAEYAKSHKLLVEYEKENNVDGMKMELAHLWSFLIQIEEKIYGTKNLSSSQRSTLFKARAKIIGDFKKYINIVLKYDPHFDFGTYYENSPYSNDTYKVSGQTISGILKLVKTIVQ